MKTILLIIGILLICGSTIKAQEQPDLWIRQVVTTNYGTFLDKVTVGVSNVCKAPAGRSYVLVTFKRNPSNDAKSLGYIGNTVNVLKGGETQAQTFDVRSMHIPATAYIWVEVDPYKKVTEASEDNNWRSLNPSAAGTLLTQSQCSAKD